MKKADDRSMVAAVRVELLEEALAQAEHDPDRADKIKSALRAASDRVAMPRVARDPTPIRRWAVERTARFGPVAPADEPQGFMRSEVLAIALGGTLPAEEDVAQIAGMVERTSSAEAALATISLVVLPSDRDDSDAVAVQHLLRAESRPRDLETLLNAALVFEFAAAHIADAVSMARLLSVAGALWWGAGQMTAATRALRIALHYDAAWPLTDTMRKVLLHRKRPEWPSQ